MPRGAPLQTLWAVDEMVPAQGRVNGMSDFEGCHFEGKPFFGRSVGICRYGASYRGLGQMVGERGVAVDHSTI